MEGCNLLFKGQFCMQREERVVSFSTEVLEDCYEGFYLLLTCEKDQNVTFDLIQFTWRLLTMDVSC